MKEGLLKYVLIVWFCHAVCCQESQEKSGADLVKEIIEQCSEELSVECAKSKAKAWLKDVSNNEEIKITDTLSLVQNEQVNNLEEQNSRQGSHWFDRIDKFLSSHSLKINTPEILENSMVKDFIPRSIYENNFAQGLVVALTDAPTEGE